MQSLKLLLDTHTLLWTIGKTGELSKTVAREIKNPNNEILVSAVSLWEIALKSSIGKLILDFDITDIPKYCSSMGFALIPLEPIDALNSIQLPRKNNHKDPFDRMLIYQCIKNNYILASRDATIRIYKKDGLKLIWE
ncbi:MAG: type II toxin-antitoxin system VapC family toxin [Treponema sp.]|nr:type II toxin-antitoxin system VapC family toxin [Treponema sp.]